MDTTKEQVKLVGPAEGKSFVLRFSGAAGLSARHAGKFFALQRLASGSWPLLKARDKDGAQIRLFIDEDKNGMQIRRETQSKMLCKVLETMLPNSEMFVKKVDATITCEWVLVARVVSRSSDDFKVECNPAVVE